MVVGSNVFAVELLVVGGGPGGYAVAERCARAGMQVALVEQAALGGTCLNVGCIPSKALLHVAGLAGGAADAADLGVALTPRVDWPKVQGWMQSVVSRLQDGVASRLAQHKVEVIRGTLRFEAPGLALVTGEMSPLRIEFEDVVIATGSRPIALPDLPVDGDRVVDSSGALALRDLPASLAVVGAGYIGIEIGTAYAKLGAAVTIVEAADRILPAMAEPLVRPVERQLTKLGVRIVCGARVTGRSEAGLVFVRGDGASDSVAADVILSAVGRRPNSDDLGLDILGVGLTPGGHVRVDAQRRAAPGVYAIGDVTEGPALAHKASAEAEIVARALAKQGARFEPACIPEVVFSDPEIATVGMRVADAAASGIDAGSTRRPLTASGRALTLHRTDGFIELVFDKADRTILGVHMVGAGVAELAGEAALAIEMGASIDDLALTIHPHPTLSEEFPELAASAVAKLGEPALWTQGAMR